MRFYSSDIVLWLIFWAVIKHMKKILSKIGKFFLTLLCVFLLLILGICFVFMLPFDYIKYKRSYFYKTEHKKYKLFAGSGIYFDLYNEIAKNNLPINYIFNPTNDSLECGWFVFDNILIIPEAFPLEYDTESEKWVYSCDEEDDDGTEKRVIMSLDEYLQTEIAEANELAGYTICDNAIVLFDADSTENRELAKKEKHFLVYEYNREEVLKKFVGY